MDFILPYNGKAERKPPKPKPAARAKYCNHCGRVFVYTNIGRQYCNECRTPRPCGHCGMMMKEQTPHRLFCDMMCYCASQGVMC